jgi:hypothetical protein
MPATMNLRSAATTTSASTMIGKASRMSTKRWIQSSILPPK